MFPNFPLFPEQASGLAGDVDRLFFFAVAVAVFFTALIGVLVIYLGVRYRRRHEGEVGEEPAHGAATTALEITWSAIPLVILLVMFFWGARIFFSMARPPSNAAEYWVTGKQWMWKIQHPEGVREINELHVPVGVPVKLTMTSEDVIHSFYVPAFRTKADVIPGRYTTVWFQPNKTGTFHLFCAEYCGAEHSRMVGRVVVLEPAEYQAWLAGAGRGRTPVESGEELFVSKACNTCHRADSAARAPILTDLFGKPVQLLDGRSAVADAAYLRESIVNPQAKIVLGYQPIMPTYKGQLSEEEIIQLIEYLKSLKSPGVAGGRAGSASPPGPSERGASQ